LDASDNAQPLPLVEKTETLSSKFSALLFDYHALCITSMDQCISIKIDKTQFFYYIYKHLFMQVLVDNGSNNLLGILE
jgi:hypothetical protein